ncbi:4,5-DOPA dioxygenase extradiol, partial [Breznakia sp. OttesenSCG-928-G09]|nr:4,5-DOPA dioxygenase extradiol [Breznakia sp. OttesenSCG-928-G09]
SPMNVIEHNQFTKGWQKMAEAIPKPKAILCISAHWFLEENAISTTKSPETIHDFYGFPEELYTLQYPAKGSTDVVNITQTSLSNQLLEDSKRGLDHGAWSVLRSMYPNADIPVNQFSVNASLSPKECYDIGTQLKKLREKGILILASGNIVHNLGLINWDMKGGYSWADDFDLYIKNAIVNGIHEDVINYTEHEAATKACYYYDHFYPLLYALGACDADESVKIYNEERLMGSMSMTSYIIG